MFLLNLMRTLKEWMKVMTASIMVLPVHLLDIQAICQELIMNADILSQATQN